MGMKGLATCLSYSIVAVLLASSFPHQAIGEHPPAAHSGKSDRHKQHSAELARVVREATRRFRVVNVAKAEGYQLMFGFVSGPDDGAMGFH